MFLPTLAFAAGVLVKLILNVILVRIPWIGVNGAAFSSVIANMTTFILAWIMLKKYIKTDLHFSNFIFKPVLATAMMSICTYFAFSSLNVIISTKIATILAIAVAVIIYILAVIVLKVLSEEDIKMLPKGEKLYKILVKFGIYESL